MKNIILDASKYKKSQYVFRGPVDFATFGFPKLSNGFFNMKCESPNYIGHYNRLYHYYFNSWNYQYQNDKEEIKELAPGKTILFITRNQDSPNLFHGNSEVINALSMMELYNLKPEDIQVVFLQGITINYEFDPFYDIYKDIISRGGEPIYIENLNNKYIISSGILVPIGWDSTCFFTGDEKLKIEIPTCKSPSKIYKLYNDLVNKYMKIPNFSDSFISDNEVFYYPKSVIENHNLKNDFVKKITIQWRRAWPKVRKGQNRILGNAIEIADKLASILPKNFLIRLVDTGGLNMKEQIALMKNTDYLVGIHGAGLSLSIFMDYNSIMHEMLYQETYNILVLMSALSGHKSFSDIIKAERKTIDGNENVFFDVDEFSQAVLKRMKEVNFL